jgi:membrane associated rhomboid family serine protease
MFAFPPLTPLVRATLIVLFASFVAQTVLEGLVHVPLFEWLALHYELQIPLAWQWATYVLVEPGVQGAPLSRALDLLFIYLWIAPFELEHGPRKTGILIGLAIVAGAILPLVLGLVLPSISVPLAGARALTWAGIGALCVRSRGAPMNFVFLPTMTAWQFAAAFLVIEALQCAWANTPTPLLASLGGLAAGVLYARHLERPRPTKKTPPAKRRVGASHLQVIPGGQAGEDRPRWLN